MTSFLKVIDYMIPLIYPISRLFKKICSDKNTILSFSHSQNFADNSKYLYLEMVNNYSGELNIYWLTSNKKVKELLSEHDLPIIYLNEFKNPRIQNFMKVFRPYAFITTGSIDKFLGFLIHYPLFFSLWHGIPLKKIMWHVKNDKELYPRSLVDRLFIFKRVHRYFQPTYLLATSKYIAKIFSSAFRMPMSKIIIDNYPRNDVLNRKIKLEELNAITKKTIEEKFSFKKLILYAPTFRDNKKQFPFTSIELEKLNNLMKKEESLLLMKLHINDYNLYKIKLSNLKLENIILIDPQLDIYPLLRDIDILITDYSSIFFDFLLVDNPIIFYSYDLDEYIKKRGLYFSYHKITPGAKVYKFTGLLEELQTIIERGDSILWKKRRKNIRNIVFDLKDGNASKRLAEFILKN